MQEPARDFESVTSVYVLITWGSCDCPVTTAKTGRDRDAAVEESLRTSFTHETSFAVRLFCPNYPALPATFLEKPRSRHTHRTTTSGWCYDFSSFHISDTFSGELNIINVFEILTYKSQTIFRESQSLSFFKNLFERLVFLILFFLLFAVYIPASIPAEGMRWCMRTNEMWWTKKWYIMYRILSVLIFGMLCIFFLFAF